MLDRRWVVLRDGDRLRWGGDLRRRYLFEGLARQTGAVVVEGWTPAAITSALRGVGGRRWQVWRRPGLVASSELLADAKLEAVRRYGVATAVDIHDERVSQNRALGIETTAVEAARLRRLLDANLETFRWLVAQSASFVRLAGLDPARTLIASNGCDTRHVTVQPSPTAPVVGFVSGAAPGRGIETLVDAARLARAEVPALELRLWLIATGDASRAYLEALTESLAGETWIRIGPAMYQDLGAALGIASILVVPHPANVYMDAVVPIKLFDSMAAGRPIVVTPRTEMAAIVERREAGLVARGDAAVDLAEPIVRLISDATLRARLGANARAAAESEFDWRVIGARLAVELVDRSQPRRWFAPRSAPVG